MVQTHITQIKADAKRMFRSAFLVMLAGMVLTASYVVPVQAVVSSPAKAQISFTFDDGRASVVTKAAPVLAKYGLRGTAFITTQCVGMVKTPNTCHAANDVSYVTWDQVLALKDTYGWEIGSHSHTHPYMASTNADDDQPNMLTARQITDELVLSRQALMAHGITPTAFASPYGDYSPETLRETAKYYTSHRGFADQGNNVWPYSDLVVNNMQVQNPVKLDSVKAKIDAAIANKYWLVLTFHDVVDKASSQQNKYQWSTSNFEAVAAYVKSKQSAGLLRSVTSSEGLVTSPTNLIPNGSFADGITSGWTTNTPGAFVPDALGNGSLYEPAHSVRLRPTDQTSHLFSPKVSVSDTTMYVVKLYVTLRSIQGGEVGIYIDEYNSDGAWVSGQYKAREASVYTEMLNVSYVPSSVQVKKARVQLYRTGVTALDGYIDSVQLFPVASMPSSPPNLVPNGTFDAGLSQGWSTDNASSVSAVAQPTPHIRYSGSGATSHLFSPRVAVTPLRQYYVETKLTIASSSGGSVGLYVDEYDTSGQWISGQYKKYLTTLGERPEGFTYTPSSSAVVSARYQTIFNGGQGMEALVDDIRWTAL